MPFDEALAVRIRKRMAKRSDVVERKMFGGRPFLVRGHMCCGIIGSDLMVRVGRDDFERLLAEPHARPMDFTGRPSRGMLYVSPEGLRTTRSLGTWLDRGLRYVLALPPKAASARRTFSRDRRA
jgi:TfoX/Sxy family transcriptional regulator of competence genes